MDFKTGKGEDMRAQLAERRDRQKQRFANGVIWMHTCPNVYV